MAIYNDFAYAKMRFGKYKGYYLKDIPDDYIKWALLKLEDRGTLEMLSVEWQRRYPKFRK